ncbi:hypothetical protein [Prosthecobacter sp.]|uniref:hypothetical protein n=1 Tax=Prosthecobacter sp. TaxID=1965333 RepID=UPI003783FBCF
MKHTLAELLTKSARSLPPQRPGRSAFRLLLPLFLEMAERGHTASSMADFLVQEKEIAPERRVSACRSIRNLLARHSA